MGSNHYKSTWLAQSEYLGHNSYMYRFSLGRNLPAPILGRLAAGPQLTCSQLQAMPHLSGELLLQDRHQTFQAQASPLPNIPGFFLPIHHPLHNHWTTIHNKINFCYFLFIKTPTQVKTHTLTTSALKQNLTDTLQERHCYQTGAGLPFKSEWGASWAGPWGNCHFPQPGRITSPMLSYALAMTFRSLSLLYTKSLPPLPSCFVPAGEVHQLHCSGCYKLNLGL